MKRYKCKFPGCENYAIDESKRMTVGGERPFLCNAHLKEEKDDPMKFIDDLRLLLKDESDPIKELEYQYQRSWQKMMVEAVEKAENGDKGLVLQLSKNLMKALSYTKFGRWVRQVRREGLVRKKRKNLVKVE